MVASIKPSGTLDDGRQVSIGHLMTQQTLHT
jgi:hypothetical protein